LIAFGAPGSEPIGHRIPTGLASHDPICPLGASGRQTGRESWVNSVPASRALWMRLAGFWLILDIRIRITCRFCSKATRIGKGSDPAGFFLSVQFLNKSAGDPMCGDM
jgi:hypothetical protein